MAWARPLPSKRWQACYRDASGRTRTAGTFARKGDAETAGEEEESRMRWGEWIDPDPSRTTVRQWALWMPTKLDLRPSALLRRSAHGARYRCRARSCAASRPTLRPTLRETATRLFSPARREPPCAEPTSGASSRPCTWQDSTGSNFTSCDTPSWRCTSTRGAGVKEVSVRAGHSSVAFTLAHYGHLYEDRPDALADRLDDLLEDRAAHMLHAE
jgi:hypothetical protein